MDSNIFIDANIIYKINEILMEENTEFYLDKKKSNIKISELNFRAQNDKIIKKNLTNLEFNAKVFQNMTNYLETFTNQILPEDIRRQCENQIIETAKLKNQLKSRLSEYLFIESSFEESLTKENARANLIIPTSYKNIISLIEKLKTEENHSFIPTKNNFRLESFLIEISNIASLKKEGHKNDRNTDERYASLILDSAIQGNNTVAFSNDQDIKHLLSVGYLALKMGNKIASKNYFSHLIKNPPKITTLNSKLHPDQRLLSSPEFTIKNYFEKYNIRYGDKTFGHISNSIINLLENIKIY